MDKPIDESDRLDWNEATEFACFKDEAARWATDHGYELSDVADVTIQGLVNRKKKYGKLYCPCRVLQDDDEWNDSIVCPCSQVHDDIAVKGHCHCNLFVKK